MALPKFDADYIRHVAGSRHCSIDIPSPVSGMILHSTFSTFSRWPARDDKGASAPLASFSVLIPDDEPAPEGNAFMFGRLTRFIEEHRAQLFRPSRRWSLGPMDEKQFHHLLRMQKSAECVVVDALPRFRDYLDEARNRYPVLRPHLKHLVSPVDH